MIDQVMIALLALVGLAFTGLGYWLGWRDRGADVVRNARIYADELRALGADVDGDVEQRARLHQ